MKAGTIIRLADGREGTVVYHGLTGDGIKWGRLNVTEADFKDTHAEFSDESAPEGFDISLAPDAMLREPELEEQLGLACVGEEYEIVSIPA